MRAYTLESEEKYLYLDGDKMLFPYGDTWVRLNRVSTDGHYEGHSDTFVMVRKDLMGIWSCSRPKVHDVVFTNSVQGK